MATRPVRLALCLALLIGSACTPKGDDTDKPKDKNKDNQATPEATVETLEDRGTACIAGAVDQPHTITVDFATCMSSSCDGLNSSSCTVEQSGAELIVHAKAEIRRTTGVCTEDCRRAEATCSTPALAAGSYTLSYAGQRLDVVVPTTEPACTAKP